MSILPGRNEDPVEKQKKAKKDMQTHQDSLGTNKLEAALVSQRQEEQENTRNQLLDPEEDKQRLKQLLLNVKAVEVPQMFHFCQECAQEHQGEPDKCSNCGQTDKGFVEKQSGSKIKWVERSEDSLINHTGFHKVVWSEIEPTISSSVAGGYLKGSEVSKLNYATLSTITMQLALYPWRYGVDNPTDMQEIGDIIRSPLIAHTSKARGGRGLESTEKTVMEKISRAFTSEEEEDDKPIF